MQFALVSQKLHVFDFIHVRGASPGEGFDGQFTAVRPAERDGVKRFAFRGETNVLGGVLKIFLERTALHLRRAFAKNQPRTRAVNRLPVDSRPVGHLVQHGFNFRVQ